MKTFLRSLSGIALVVFSALPLCGQSTTLRVVDAAGRPIAFATVSIEGLPPLLVDASGNVALTAGRNAALKITVRRIGYEPWFGRVAVADTASLTTVHLRALPQTLAEVRIADSTTGPSLHLAGFYRRALDRQRGLGSGVFITPEEIDARNSIKLSQLFQGLNGLRLKQVAEGRYVPLGQGGLCQMTVLVDGYPIDMTTQSTSTLTGIRMGRGAQVTDFEPKRDKQIPALEDVELELRCGRDLDGAAKVANRRETGLPKGTRPPARCL